MKYIKFLLAVLLAGSFVACGQEQQAQSTSEAPSINSLDAYVQANQAKLQDARAKSQFKMALESLELLQTAQETGVQNRSAVGGAVVAGVAVFEAKTIPDRIKLGLKVLEAIVEGSTELKNKQQGYLDLFALRVTISLIDVINPLSDTKSTYANLEKALKKVRNAPEQNGDDLANMHVRQELENRLTQYRFYKFNQTKASDYNVNDKLDLVVLQATGVRLDPLATVDGVKNTIAQVNAAATKAMANQMPDDFVRPASKPFSWDLINKEQAKAGIDMGKETLQLLSEVTEAFIKMAKNSVSVVSGIKGGKIDFDFASIPARIAVLKEVATAIALGTGELSNKIQIAHTRIGFASAQAIVSAANPLSKKAEVEGVLADLKQAIEFAKNSRDLQPNDTSSINHKESLAKLLRSYRLLPLKEFLYKPQQEIDKFNAMLLRATGIRLDPTQTVKQVEDLKASLAKEVARLKALPNATKDTVVANFWKKDDLRVVIDRAFFTNKSKLSDEQEKAFNDAIWNARGVYLDIKASVKLVHETRQVLMDYMREANK